MTRPLIRARAGLARAALAALSLALALVSCVHAPDVVELDTDVGANDVRRRDPLPSWRSSAAKSALLAFAAGVADQDSPIYLAPEARVAVFDNDGTLWVEKPLPTQAVFAIDRVRALSPAHPEWRATQPFQAILEGDRADLERIDLDQLLDVNRALNTGVTATAFDQVARAWLAKAVHPRFRVRYTELAYLPMLELLAYLRANGFKTYICSGGGLDFVRAFSEPTYGIPPEQVIGTSFVSEVRADGGELVIVRTPELLPPVSDRAGKPVNIERVIGRRPILAVGNSDGDIQMLEFTAERGRPRLAVLVHHDDAEREYAYNEGAEGALRAARERAWVVVSMRDDFARLFRRW